MRVSWPVPASPQADRLGHQPASVGGLTDQQEHLREIKWLEQVIKGAELHGLNGGLGSAIGGNQDDGQAGPSGM
jgi:hypothetical protein